jgi:hypothetical protein
VIVFGIILLVCAEEVIRLARDARADMDSERTPDVFTRRWRSLRMWLRRGRFLAAKPETRRLMTSPTVFLPKPGRDTDTRTLSHT